MAASPRSATSSDSFDSRGISPSDVFDPTAALILVPDNPSVQTVPLALSFFSGAARSSDPAVTAAAAVLVALPVLLAYVFLQRRLISGLTEGAVK